MLISFLDGRSGKSDCQGACDPEGQGLVTIVPSLMYVRVASGGCTGINTLARLNLEKGDRVFVCTFSLLWAVSLGSSFILSLLKFGHIYG